MKKTIICNISMSIKMETLTYSSEDASIPVSERAVRYPVCQFLDKTLNPDDDVTVLLLVKEDKYSNWKDNVDAFKADAAPAFERLKKTAEIKIIKSDFSEDEVVHNKLMGAIADSIEPETHIIADITYGPKDLPIVVFAALNFAEKHLACEIDQILYGKGNYENGKVTNGMICDMSPLFYLNAVSDAIHCEEPAKSKEILKTLLSM